MSSNFLPIVSRLEGGLPYPLYRQRWLIIYNALVAPGKAEDIARNCGVSKATVHAVISSYNRQRADAVGI
jgi:hypothetical protein